MVFKRLSLPGRRISDRSIYDEYREADITGVYLFGILFHWPTVSMQRARDL